MDHIDWKLDQHITAPRRTWHEAGRTRQYAPAVLPEVKRDGSAYLANHKHEVIPYTYCTVSNKWQTRRWVSGRMLYGAVCATPLEAVAAFNAKLREAGEPAYYLVAVDVEGAA